MRAIKLTALCLAVSLPAIAPAARAAPVVDERALREECGASSQAGMRDCLSKKADDSQKALRQAEEKAVSAISKWDEDKKYVNDAVAKLAASNKEFAKYRETQCKFSASLSGGGAGNAHEVRRLACITELNNKRADQLGDVVSDLPSK